MRCTHNVNTMPIIWVEQLCRSSRTRWNTVPHHSAPLRTTPHHSAPLRTTPHHSVPLRTFRTTPYHSAPLRTTPHHSAPLRTTPKLITSTRWGGKTPLLVCVERPPLNLPRTNSVTPACKLCTAPCRRTD